MSFSINLLPTRTPVVLGIAPGARRVGLAVMDSQDLLCHRVLNVGQIRSREGKEIRLRQVVSGLLDDYRVTHAVVVQIELAQLPELLSMLLLWFTQEAKDRLIDVRDMPPDAIRRALVGSARERANNRNLAEVLSRRFPQLHDLAPSAHPAPGSTHLPELAATPSCLPTNRERYWRGMFLALGGALLTRDQLLAEEVSH